jgi:hypothetical protein
MDDFAAEIKHKRSVPDECYFNIAGCRFYYIGLKIFLGES